MHDFRCVRIPRSALDSECVPRCKQSMLNTSTTLKIACSCIASETNYSMNNLKDASSPQLDARHSMG